MFKTILIANRGEIACRIIKTARRMGIRTVAVYSEADKDALHVEMADEAVAIGPPAASESYLVIDKIVAACLKTGAEAVHPGYGFLSERAAFAHALAEANIVFIGPNPKAIEAMGDKIESKKFANAAKVSTVPGHLGVIESPERAAEIHVNEGVCEVFDIIFPPKGTLITPEWPAATNARSFVLLRCLGLLAGVVAQAVDGRMPADQETIRYTGFYGNDRNGKSFLSREVLGGGSGGRYYADGNDAIHIVPDSRNQPAEFTETRFPLLVEKLGLRTDSGGAGTRRGGLGYEKHYRALVDCRTIVTADRVRLGCYGVNGGKAGLPFCVTIDTEGTPRDLGGLVDGEPVLAGQIVRVRTTGGGGWGDPLERDPDLVLRDLIDGKVSPVAARDDYGVVLRQHSEDVTSWIVDDADTKILRDRRRAERQRDQHGERPIIDRGDGFEKMLRGEFEPWIRSK